MRPRDVRLTAGGRALVGVVAALLVGGVVAGLTLELKAERERDELRVFREQTVETTGSVTRKWRTTGEGRRTWIAYEFVADGRSHRGEVRVTRARWNRIEVGSSVPVRYAASRPEQNYPWGREPRPLPPLIPYLAGLGLIVSGGLLVLPISRQRRLLTEGRPALASVTRHKSGKYGKTAEYEFAVLSGSRARGNHGPTNKPAPIGSTLWVIYAPEHPRHNAPYPLSLVKLARDSRLEGHGRRAGR